MEKGKTGERKHRHEIKKLTCDILKLLQQKTDKQHTITIQQLQELLAGLDDEFGRAPDRKTVRLVLETLREAYTGPGKIICSETEKQQQTKDGQNYVYRYGWYFEREFSAEELEMLLNDVLFSRMRTEEQAKNLVQKLQSLASPYRQDTLAYTRDLPDALYTVSPLVQRNLGFVQRVISGNLHSAGTETVVSFRFNGYGSDGKLHEVPGGKYQNVLPLKLVENGGQYYLVCLLDGKTSLSNLRLDLITRLEKQTRPKPADAGRERAIRRMSSGDAVADYLTKHFYMGYEQKGERPGPVYLRVKKLPGKPNASLTILHDAFGRNYKLIKENGQYADVRVESIVWSITAFVQQYMGRVRVLGPEPVKKAVEEALQSNLAAYFEIPAEE